MKQTTFSCLSIMYLFIFCFFANSLSAETFTKTFEESYDGKDKVEFKQRKGTLDIKPSPDGKVKWITKISINSSKSQDAEALFKKFEVDINEFGDRLSVELEICCIRKWNQSNEKNTIVFMDGTKLKNIKNFSLTTILYLPEVEELRLDNSFTEISIDSDISIKDAEFTLYHSNLSGGNINGKLDLKHQFGHLELKNIAGEADFDLYHAKVELENMGPLELKSQFSKLKMNDIESLESKSYHDVIEANQIKAELDIDQQFSNLDFESIGSARIKAYHGSMDVATISPDFEHIEINAQFFSVDFKMPNTTPYTIKAEMSFGSFLAPQDMVFVTMVDKMNNKEYELKSANATETSPSLDIKAYHGNIKLK